MVLGFISSVLGHKINNRYMVLAKVRHSQRMNDPLIHTWIITHKDRIILSVHCAGCISGLGECCFHIASVLFYIEYWKHMNGKLSCTQVKCTWLLPTYIKPVDYARVRDIDFTSVKKLNTKVLTNQLKIWQQRTSSLLVPIKCLLLFLEIIITSELQYQKQMSSNNFMILSLNARTSLFA